MILAVLIFLAAIVLVLQKFGMTENSLGLFMVVAVFVIISTFMLKDKLNCPFSKKCPLKKCPLNKAEE